MPAPTTNGTTKGDTGKHIETDLLIVGAGPAGASLACFLSQHGLQGIMLSAAPGTSDTPRAHITNMAAMECLRDIGLEEECVGAATQGDCMQHTRWCHDMTGVEWARIYSWGNDPTRHGDYAAASPCNHVDLPQTSFEPIVVRRAHLGGWTNRFNTSFLSLQQEESGMIVSTVRDDLIGHEYTIRSKYLFGCDGARSQIIRELKVPLIKKPGQGLAINALVRVDLTPYVEHRNGNLHWIFQPEKDYPDYGWSCLTRMVKPWTEWMFIIFPDPAKNIDIEKITNKQWLRRVRDFVGNDDIPAEIIDVSKWYINEIIAEYYADGNVFCLGDAVHRHPPFNGLGSNTCIQDAYNLAWKIAYVTKGLAGPSLLDSYNAERQPVGLAVITRANQGIRDHIPVWKALGVMEPTVEARMKQFDELKQATPAGAARRKALKVAVEGTAHEFHGLGVEMNQRYESKAICAFDEKPRPPLPEDPILEHEITTYPGSRLPHAWLNTRNPGKLLSMQDLAGHGVFCLFTGIGGEKWKSAVVAVAKELSVEIRTYSIGWMQDYEDAYSDWERRNEIQEDGCVLVRPDRFVAWRSKGMIEDCEGKLLKVMKHVLSR